VCLGTNAWGETHFSAARLVRLKRLSRRSAHLLLHTGSVSEQHSKAKGLIVLSDKKIFIWSLWRLVADRGTLAPRRLFNILWRCITQAPRQAVVFKLFNQPVFTSVVRQKPLFPFKYLSHSYLLTGLTPQQHGECFVHHYQKLCRELPDQLLRTLNEQELELFRCCQDDQAYAITLCLSNPVEIEGELSLNLRVDGEIVFILSFTIVPGSIVHSQAPEVMLVTRLQGVQGQYREIRSATKAMCDIAPPALLVAALAGFGLAFGVREMAGVDATRQLAFEEVLEAHFLQAYDHFFLEIGALRNEAGYFISPLPTQDKPIGVVKHGHKLRTREKRAFKSKIAKQAVLSIQQAAGQPLPASPFHFPIQMPGEPSPDSQTSEEPINRPATPKFTNRAQLNPMTPDQ